MWKQTKQWYDFSQHAPPNWPEYPGLSQCESALRVALPANAKATYYPSVVSSSNTNWKWLNGTNWSLFVSHGGFQGVSHCSTLQFSMYYRCFFSTTFELLGRKKIQIHLKTLVIRAKNNICSLTLYLWMWPFNVFLWNSLTSFIMKCQLCLRLNVFCHFRWGMICYSAVPSSFPIFMLSFSEKYIWSKVFLIWIYFF